MICMVNTLTYLCMCKCGATHLGDLFGPHIAKSKGTTRLILHLNCNWRSSLILPAGWSCILFCANKFRTCDAGLVFVHAHCKPQVPTTSSCKLRLVVKPFLGPHGHPPPSSPKPHVSQVRYNRCRGPGQQSLQSYDEEEQAMLDKLLPSTLTTSVVEPPTSSASAGPEDTSSSPATPSNSTALGVVGMLRRLKLWTEGDASNGKLTILPSSIAAWLRSTGRYGGRNSDVVSLSAM